MIEAPCVITLTGDYDVYTTPKLENALIPANDARDVIIDFTGVKYIDSTSITVLIRMTKQRAIAGLPAPSFAGLSATIKRVLTIVSLHETWPWYDNVESAVASLAG